jgi:hypothetical protein
MAGRRDQLGVTDAKEDASGTVYHPSSMLVSDTIIDSTVHALSMAFLCRSTLPARCRIGYWHGHRCSLFRSYALP